MVACQLIRVLNHADIVLADEQLVSTETAQIFGQTFRGHSIDVVVADVAGHLIGAQLREVAAKNAVIKSVEDKQKRYVHPRLWRRSKDQIYTTECHHHYYVAKNS